MPVAKLACRVVNSLDVGMCDWVVGTVKAVVDPDDVAFSFQIGHVFGMFHRVNQFVQ